MIESKEYALKKKLSNISNQWKLPCFFYVLSWIVTSTVANVVTGFTIVLKKSNKEME